MDRKHSAIDDLFKLSVTLKGAAAAIEILTGIAVFFIPVDRITGWVISIANVELSEDPGSFIATRSLLIAHAIPEGRQYFIVAYLLSRGIIKIALVVALLKNKLWAYPASLAVLGIFMVYQAYEVFARGSIPLLLLTLFDFVVMYLIWREYRLVQARHAMPSVAPEIES